MRHNHVDATTSNGKLAIAAVIVVVIAPFWTWAFVVDPGSPADVGIRLGLAILLFGGTSLTAWCCLRQGFWKVLLVVVIGLSATTAVVCVFPYLFLRSQYWEPIWSSMTFFDASYLGATSTVALSWCGLVRRLSCRRNVRWLRWGTIVAILALLLLTFYIFATDKANQLGLDVAIISFFSALTLGFAALCGTALVVVGHRQSIALTPKTPKRG